MPITNDNAYGNYPLPRGRGLLETALVNQHGSCNKS